MIRINQDKNNNAPILDNPIKAPKSKSYLLNQPIKDEVSFNTGEKPKKKNNTLAWILGITTVVVGIGIAIKTHKKPSLKNSEEKIKQYAEEYTEKLKKEHSKGPSQDLSSSNRTSNSSSSNASRKKPNSAFTESETKNKTTSSSSQGHTTSNNEELKLESLKKTLFSKLGSEIDFNKPSEIINDIYTKKVNLDVETLESLDDFTKKQQPLIKDSVEAEKTRHSRLYILRELNKKYIKYDFEKPKLTYSKIDSEIDEIMEKYFKKDWSNSSNETKDFSDKLKTNIKYSTKVDEIPPNEIFISSLNTINADKISEVKYKLWQLNAETIKKEAKPSIFAEAQKQLHLCLEINNNALSIVEDLKLSKNSKDYKTVFVQFTQMHQIDSELMNFWENNLQNIYLKNHPNAETGLKDFKYYLKLSGINVEGVENINSILTNNLDKSELKQALKKAYKQMAIKYHPDKNPGNKETEEILKQINNAYDDMGLR